MKSAKKDNREATRSPGKKPSKKDGGLPSGVRIVRIAYSEVPSNEKSASKKSTRRSQVAEQSTVRATLPIGLPDSSNGTRYERPRFKNPETAEEREKRLAKREALTLRVFQKIYEEHHRHKAS